MLLLYILLIGLLVIFSWIFKSSKEGQKMLRKNETESISNESGISRNKIPLTETLTHHALYSELTKLCKKVDDLHTLHNQMIDLQNRTQKEQFDSYRQLSQKMDTYFSAYLSKSDIVYTKTPNAIFEYNDQLPQAQDATPGPIHITPYQIPSAR